MKNRSNPNSASNELIVRGVQSADEWIAANKLVARTQLFDEQKALAWLASAGRAWPDFCWENVRIALLDDLIVGALRVIEVPLRIGEARLSAGGIGWVSTDASFRGRGICSALMADAHAFMTDKGWSLSLLFGVPDLYQRYGYVSAIPERSVLIDVELLPKDLLCQHTTRPFLESDVSAMLALHDAADREASCSIVRHHQWVTAQAMSTEPKTPLFPDWKGTIALVDEADQLDGWLMPQPDQEEYHVKDLGARDLTACQSLLVAAARMAEQAGIPQVRFHVPPFHLFARYLERFDSTHETRYFRQREGMLAVLQLEQTLRAMIPEWRARLETAAFDPRQHMDFAVEGQAFAIRYHQGEVRLDRSDASKGLELTNRDLLLLLVGCHRAEDILACRWADLGIEQRRLVDILFPRREPFIWPIDHF